MNNDFDPMDEMDEMDELRHSRMQRKKEYRRRETRGWVFSLVIAIVIALTLRFFVFEFIRVDGRSMEPTLYSDEYVFMEKVTYWFREPELGDIIICDFPGRTETFVKRVIGEEGDVLEITDGILYINGEANYDYFSDYIDSVMAPVVVPEDSVFVMGDNRNNSSDSRVVGAITYDKILGKAVFVLWPLDQIHGLN